MKTTTIALAALLAGFAATAARADSRVHVGINVNTNPVYRTPAPTYYPPVVVAPAPYPVYAPVVAPRGYWKDVTVKTWVPDRWNTGRDRWGRPIRFFERGHFAFTTSRVWVDGRHDGRPDRWNNGNHYGWNNNHR